MKRMSICYAHLPIDWDPKNPHTPIFRFQDKMHVNYIISIGQQCHRPSFSLRLWLETPHNSGIAHSTVNVLRAHDNTTGVYTLNCVFCTLYLHSVCVQHFDIDFSRSSWVCIVHLFLTYCNTGRHRSVCRLLHFIKL